jgi:hypothetical protein
MVVAPEIVPGVEGTSLTDMASGCGILEPQALIADTVMVPLAGPVVAIILVVLEVPLHPPGKTQL